MSLCKFRIGKDRCRSSGEPRTHGLTCHGHRNEPQLDFPLFFCSYHSNHLHISDVVGLDYFYVGFFYSPVVCT